ncbi:glycosyltransferase family 2 protein [Pseudomonadota bacterium]
MNDLGGFRRRSIDKVSVIVTNYNYSEFLPECIDSVLHQTYGNIEIIVVDDGSTDSSRAVLSKYVDQILLLEKENGGQASAFNAAIEVCTGDVVCFLDSDDVWYPNKVISVVKKFESGEFSMVCHDMEIAYENTESPSSELYYKSIRTKLTEGDLYEQIAWNGYNWVFPPTSGISVTRECAKSIYPLPEQEWRICADNPIAYGAAYLGPIGVVEEPLGIYRIHGNNYFHGCGVEDFKSLAEKKIESVIQKFKIYNYLRSQIYNGGKDVISPFESYYFYRNWIYITKDVDIGSLVNLIIMNIKYHKGFKCLPIKNIMQCVKYIIFDILLHMIFIFNIPSQYLKQRKVFRYNRERVIKMQSRYMN